MPNAVYLTKSRYTAGLQCLRRLWLNVREPPEWDEPDAGSVERRVPRGTEHSVNAL